MSDEKPRTMKFEVEIDLDRPLSPREVSDLYLERMLAHFGHNVTKAAKRLRTGRTTIYRRKSAGAVSGKGVSKPVGGG